MADNPLVKVIVAIILAALAFWLLGMVHLPEILNTIFTIAIVVLVVLFIVGSMAGWTWPWKRGG